MKNIATIIIVLMLLPLHKASAQQSSSTADDLQYAEYLVNNGKDALAYQTLNSLIKRSPSCHYAYYLRALQYYHNQNNKSALYDIDEALKRRPIENVYLMLKGDILFTMEKYDKAAAAYAKAIRNEDVQPAHLYAAALAYMRAKDYDNATRYATRLLELTPESDSAKMISAEIYIESDNSIDALRLINTVNKHDAAFYRLRGIAYCKAQMNQYSINDLNSAIDIDPSLHDIYLWRGLAKYQDGDRDGAHADWNNAISLRQYRAKELLQKYR
ncbi:MAG: tetratricopeptide repeat protein [Bacteroidales bacterium]|nr:tetratricopeptide repeat protein [Bacteroidales bacterium]